MVIVGIYGNGTLWYMWEYMETCKYGNMWHMWVFVTSGEICKSWKFEEKPKLRKMENKGKNGRKYSSYKLTQISKKIHDFTVCGNSQRLIKV